VNASAPDVGKYLPDQLAPLQSRLADLKASFDKKDYQTVLTNAPGLEKDATNLAQSAAAQKAEIAKALETQWSELAASVPTAMDPVKARVVELGKMKGKRVPKGIDLPGAKADLADADTLWQQAQTSHTAGDLEKAASTAKDAKAKIDAAAAAIKLDLAATAGSAK
jgi:hypothetical protein